MSATRTCRRPRSRHPGFLQKPRGAFHPRVQKVGPEHFGIVSVDCAKARFKWMLCDFYGNVLVPPTKVAHTRAALDEAIAQLRQAMTAHALHDVLVAIERTGRYHHVPQRAFTQAGFDTRIVHPFATKQFRQPQDPGNKTDDTDLAAIDRAAVSGFALIEAPLPEPYAQLQLLVRHRRDLVRKAALLCCQIREHLDVALPGYAACFDPLWDSAPGLYLARQLDSPEAFQQAGQEGLAALLRAGGVRFQQRTLERILSWAETAPSGPAMAPFHHRIAWALDDDRLQKGREIQALERESAALLVRTPYVLLLTFPGLGVVSTADFAGEMGPIPNYASARAITGRAGLFPARYQSDEVDNAHGPLVRCANRRLRAVILNIADNLIQCNHHFNALAVRWRAAGKDPRHSHVKVALRFCRIAYVMVAGQQVFHHPAVQQRSYLLDKLLAFHREHETPMAQVLADLQAAIDQLPKTAYAAEAEPLLEQYHKIEAGRRRGPQVLGDILPLVFARLGVDVVQSKVSGEHHRT
jgi:transposase